MYLRIFSLASLVAIVSVLQGCKDQFDHENKRTTIENNLRLIAVIGQGYLVESGEDEVSVKALIESGYVNRRLEGIEFSDIIQPVAGEDYSSLVISPAGTLTVESDVGLVMYGY